MSKRSALLSFAIVVAVAAVAGWWLLHRGPESIVAPAAAKSAPAVNEAQAAGEAPAPPPALEPERKPVSEPTTQRRGLFGALFGSREKEKANAPEEPKTIAIDGVVIVTDAQGEEHREENGTLTPQFFEPPGKDERESRFRVARTGEEVSVTAGRFHLEAPPDCQLGIQKLEVGGRPARFTEEPIFVEAGKPVTFRARWIDGIRLHVVDATSRVELDDVTVARQGERHFSRTPHPGAAASLQTAVDHTASPVVVAPVVDDFRIETHDVVFVRAAGHAWARVDLQFERETEKTVELVPAATLVVTLDGELPRRAPSSPSLEEVAERFFGGKPARAKRDQEAGPKLCLREKTETPSFDDAIKEALDHFDEAKPADFPGGKKPTLEEFKRFVESMRGQYEATQDLGELVLSQPAALGETRLDALVPGEFVVSVELGDESSTPLVASKAAVKLVAGETSRVALLLTAVHAPEPVPLAGTLFIPDGWSAKDLRLRIEPIDLPGKTRADERRIGVKEMVALSGRPGWYRWNAGEVLPATYSLSVEGSGFVLVEKVGPSGNDHLELKLAEPATLIVHVVDEASGEPVELKWLDYEATSAEMWFGAMKSIHLDHDGDPARYVAKVPVGTGALQTFGDQDWTLDEAAAQVEIHSGSQEVTLRVRRSCGVLVALSCGGAKVAWPEDLGWECKIESIDGKGDSTWTTTRDDLPCFGVSAPGRYRVKPPEIPGYSPVEPFEVDVPAGRFITHTVELRRN